MLHAAAHDCRALERMQLPVAQCECGDLCPTRTHVTFHCPSRVAHPALAARSPAENRLLVPLLFALRPRDWLRRKRWSKHARLLPAAKAESWLPLMAAACKPQVGRACAGTARPLGLLFVRAPSPSPVKFTARTCPLSLLSAMRSCVLFSAPLALAPRCSSFVTAVVLSFGSSGAFGRTLGAVMPLAFGASSVTTFHPALRVSGFLLMAVAPSGSPRPPLSILQLLAP